MESNAVVTGGFFTFLIIAGAIALFLSGIRIIRPTRRGLIEKFGKYSRFA